MATAKTPILYSKLDIPRDVHGLLVETRREMARSIGRVKHNPEKHKTVIATFKTFIKYAEARFQDAVEREKVAAMKREEERAVSKEISANAAIERAAKLRADGNALVAQADRIEGKSE